MFDYPNSLFEAFQRTDNKAIQKKVFIETQSGRMTYEEVNDTILRMSCLFNDWGLKEGDYVAISIRNDLYSSVVFLSLIFSGITVVMIDPETKKEQAQFLMKYSSPKGLIIDQELLKDWGQVEIPNILEVSVDERTSFISRLLKKNKAETSNTFPLILSSLKHHSLPQNINPERDAYVLFTSGTTSNPKGVRISHRAMITHLKTLSKKYGYHSDVRILNVLNMSHVDGIFQGPIITYFNMASLYRPVTLNISSIPELLDAVYHHKITHFIAVPTMLSFYIKYGIGQEDAFITDDFKFIVSCASNLESDLWSKFETMFGVRIVNMYGLTETVTGGFFSGPDDDSHKIGTIGKPFDCKAKIIDEEGKELGDGISGELLVTGDHIMSGYLNAKEATDKVFLDNWFRTGDIAVRDSEGFYTWVGRIKSIIKPGGIIVYPEEVTEVINKYTGVLETVTFGMPDPVFTEIVVSAVSAVAGTILEENKIIEFCRDHLVQNKVPKRIYILPELPKGRSGKVQLEEVKKIVLGTIALTENNQNMAIIDKVRDVAAVCFKVDAKSLSMETTAEATPGWDSLSHLELASSIEKSFNIKLTVSEVMTIR